MDSNSNYQLDSRRSEDRDLPLLGQPLLGQPDPTVCNQLTSITIDDAGAQLAAPQWPRERSNSASEQSSRKSKPYGSYLCPAETPWNVGGGGGSGRKRSLSSQMDSPLRSSCRSLGLAEHRQVKRSPSSRSRSRCGSEFFMGSSVTFCNILGASDLGMTPSRDQESAALRRSCSITLVYPTESLLDPADDRMRSFQGASTNRSSYQYPTSLLLSPPTITFDRVTAASPMTPTFQRYNTGCNSRFGSAYQLQAQSKSVMVTPRGSFLAINQSPLEFRESMLSINYPNYCDDGEEVSLVYTRLEKIPMKDFAAEIRAHLDVEHFLSQAQLMLDIQETNMEQILDSMLHHLLDKEETTTAFQEAMKVIFTDSSAHQLSKTIQCTCRTYAGGSDYDQSWVCVLCTVGSVQKRHVAIARLRNPANLGRTCQDVFFIILVVTSTKEKGTKNALETGRTFATLFADMDLRLQLLGARSEQEFKQLMWEHMKELAEEHCDDSTKRKLSDDTNYKEDATANLSSSHCWFVRGLRADLRRRIPHYLSDFKDGFAGANTVHKTISTIFFLYFACILPAIALGVLNSNNTEDKINVRKAIYSQTIGGLVFAIFGGQPMVIVLTTAPLALYTKIIFNICQDWELNFFAMYACTGLWNSFFLLIYAFTDASKLMKWCTRSTEEIFALFISMAFAVDAFKDVVSNFNENYNSPKCSNYTTEFFSPTTVTSNIGALALKSVEKSMSTECLRENSLLYLLLMLGTVWLGLSLYNFTKTPFLNAGKRELLADCALPVSVILMSFFGSYVFRDVKLKKFDDRGDNVFEPPPLETLSWKDILGAMGLGFCLSLLFFMDHNTAGAMVNSPDNRMKKGPAYHWDLLVVALLNAFLAFFGLPMVHGALPHSPLHVRAMADKEDRVYQGRVHLKIVSVRETRVTGIVSHIMIGLSLQFIDQLQLIPRPVLDGLFLYLAVTALDTNQLFERIMLLLTEQAAYPPNHYIRTVPQRKIHLFTFVQLLQLAMLCGFGFAPVTYLKMVFPILHLIMLPIRHKVVPHLFEKKFLQSLDGH